MPLQGALQIAGEAVFEEVAVATLETDLVVVRDERVHGRALGRFSFEPDREQSLDVVA